MTGPYKEDGSGTLWVPNLADDEEERQQNAENLVKSLKESIQEENYEQQWLGGYNEGDFKLEEMYVDDHKKPELKVNGEIGDVFVSLSVPIKNNDEMQKIAQQINEVVTIDPDSSGLYLKPKDFSEVRNKTADSQGRINLGKDYSGEDVRVVVLDED